MREKALDKGRRYTSEGRLVIEAVDTDSARATCRGDGVIYALGFERGRWHCNCLARGRCAHLYALGCVVSFEVQT